MKSHVTGERAKLPTKWGVVDKICGKTVARDSSLHKPRVAYHSKSPR